MTQQLAQLFSGDNPLTGFMQGQQAAQTDWDNQISSAKSLEDLHRAQQMNPFDIQVRQGEAAQMAQDTSTQGLANRLQKQTGEAQVAGANGLIAEFSKNAKAQEAMAEALSKASVAEQQSTVTGLDTFIAKGKAGGPAGLAMAIQDLGPNEKKMVASIVQAGQDPFKYASELRELIVSRMADNPAHRGKIAEIGATGAWHKDVANINATERSQTAAAGNTRAEIADEKNRVAIILQTIKQQAGDAKETKKALIEQLILTPDAQKPALREDIRKVQTKIDGLEQHAFDLLKKSDGKATTGGGEFNYVPGKGVVPVGNVPPAPTSSGAAPLPQGTPSGPSAAAALPPVPTTKSRTSNLKDGTVIATYKDGTSDVVVNGMIVRTVNPDQRLLSGRTPFNPRLVDGLYKPQ